MAAGGHLLVEHAGRLLMSSSFPYAYDQPWGSHWDLDHLWSSERLQVEHVGAEHWRTAKLRAIADEPLVQRYLRVCHENRSPTWLNCSECEKCVRTQLTLAGCGRLAAFAVFNQERDLAERVDALPSLASTYRVDGSSPVSLSQGSAGRWNDSSVAPRPALSAGDHLDSGDGCRGSASGASRSSPAAGPRYGAASRSVTRPLPSETQVVN